MRRIALPDQRSFLNLTFILIESIHGSKYRVVALSRTNRRPYSTRRNRNAARTARRIPSADIVDILESLEPEHAILVFSLLPDYEASEVLDDETNRLAESGTGRKG